MSDLQVKRMQIGNMNSPLLHEIDSFNDKHYGTVFHETMFNTIASETLGTVLSYYLAYVDGRLAGICPCHTISQGLTKSSFSNLTSFDIPYGGWVYDSSAVSLGRLLQNTKTKFNEALHVSSNIEIMDSTPYRDEAVSHTAAKTVLLDLSASSEDDIFASFTHAQRNKIRKAEKLGVEIKSIGPENFSAFFELVSELKIKVNKQIRERDYYSRIFSQYFQQGRACCYVAQYEGVNISTLLLLANHSYTTIWIGGRKMGIPNNLYQNELMIWESIKRGKSHGSEYFDLCVLNEDKYPNLARMKLSFSKNVRDYYLYSMKGLAYKILNHAQKRRKKTI